MNGPQTIIALSIAQCTASVGARHSMNATYGIFEIRSLLGSDLRCYPGLPPSSLFVPSYDPRAGETAYGSFLYSLPTDLGRILLNHKDVLPALHFTNDEDENLIHYNCLISPYTASSSTSRRVDTKYWARMWIKGGMLTMNFDDYQSFIHDALSRGHLDLARGTLKRQKDSIGNFKPLYRFNFEPGSQFCPSMIKQNTPGLPFQYQAFHTKP